MRWQFVDCVDRYRPWSRIEGRKTVSFEEYSLLDVFGRSGVLPPALALESLVQLAGWFVAASSDFATGCLLCDAEGLTFARSAGRGAVLVLSAQVSVRDGDRVRLEVRAAEACECVCTGELLLNLVPLQELHDPEEARALWQALYRPEGS